MRRKKSTEIPAEDKQTLWIEYNATQTEFVKQEGTSWLRFRSTTRYCTHAVFLRYRSMIFNKFSKNKALDYCWFI